MPRWLDRVRRTLALRRERLAAEEAETRREGPAILVSILVAVVLWFSFSMRETYTTSVTIPLEIAELPDGLALAVPPPETATVVLQGPGEDLLSLLSSPPSIRIVAEDEIVEVAAAIASARLPARVRVLSAQPARIRLATEARVSRMLPVRLDGTIEATPPYDLVAPPRLRPDSVRVEGAASVLDGLDAWPTTPLSRSDVERSFSMLVPLSDTLRGLVDVSASASTISVAVAQFTVGERTLAVEVENLPPGIAGVRFDPATVEASYQVPAVGPTYSIADTSSGFRAVVDFGDIARDSTSGSVRVAARPPGDLDVRGVRLDPPRVGYFIVREPSRRAGAAAGPDGER